MRILTAAAIFIILCVSALGPALAERDWEYWTQESFSFALNKKLSLIILPEWRFKNDMHEQYMFKLENGLNFKLNNYLEFTPYYVYQEKKAANSWDASNLSYFDTIFKYVFKDLWELKLSNRLRWQYDFDKGKSVIRNSARISRSFKVFKLGLTPYLSEEPFYDAKRSRLTEHRSSAGLSLDFNRNISLAAGYMLNSKKGTGKWTYANVLVSNLNIKF